MYFSEIDKNITRYITQGIRKAFKLSDKHKSIQLAARVEKPKYNKDGKLSKNPLYITDVMSVRDLQNLLI